MEEPHHLMLCLICEDVSSFLFFGGIAGIALFDTLLLDELHVCLLPRMLYSLTILQLTLKKGQLPASRRRASPYSLWLSPLNFVRKKCRLAVI